jgi:hypothetical protein
MYKKLLLETNLSLNLENLNYTVVDLKRDNNTYFFIYVLWRLLKWRKVY